MKTHRVETEISEIREQQAATGDRWFGALRLMQLEKSIETSQMHRSSRGIEAWILDLVTMAAFEIACWQYARDQVSCGGCEAMGSLVEGMTKLKRENL